MDHHEQNRKKVCILCLTNNKNVRPISERNRVVIRERFLHDIDSRISYYPTSICTTCRIHCNTGSGQLQLHKYKHDFKYFTRSNDNCKCEICEAANVVIGTNLPGTVRKKLLPGRPKKYSSEGAKILKICNVCLTEVKRGKRHSCNSSERVENLSNILKDDALPKAAEAAVSNFLAEKITPSGSEQIRLSNRRGKPSHFQKVSPSSASSNNDQKIVRSEDLFKIKTDNSLSMRKTLGVMNGLKRSGVSFETGIKSKLTKMNSQLKDLFSTIELGQVTGAENVKLGQFANQPVVYCNNVSCLIEQIKNSRQQIKGDDQVIKLGIDGGGGFLKITLSVISKSSAHPTNSFKDSGVKRLHIIALVPNLPEKYEYIALIWNNLLHLNNLQSIVAGDLKIINVIVGIMAHSSAYPCPYCEVAKKDLGSTSGVPRTIGTIKMRSSNIVKSQSRNEHVCCIHPPLVAGKNDDRILEICPPPPLHITLGIVNAVFKAVEKLHPDWADLWAHKAHVRHQQRAYGFTGRACHSLINAATVLKDNEDLDEYCNVLKHFQNIYTKCFSFQLMPGFEDDINEFVKCWEHLNLPKTSKYHILKFHVEEFCNATGRGLGVHNEQASESVHSDFGFTWERYKTVQTSKSYKSQLYNAVVDYNSGHL